MSTKFAPLEIPPGVVAQETKRVRSSNWSEVNAIRWMEGKLKPIGGQQVITYGTNPPFATRCRAIHQWYDLSNNFYTAYLCEQNVYVDINGTLSEITPTGGLAAPASPAGGFGIGQYGEGNYGTPPRPGASYQAELAIIPDVYSIDNFGALLLVMTSPDGRLLVWNPATPTTPLVQQPATSGIITALGTITPGSGYTNGTYNDVPLTGGAGTGALANVTIAGGVVTAVTIVAGGQNYAVGNTLSFANTSVGGTGSGYSQPVSTVQNTLSPKGRLFVVTSTRFVMIFGMFDDGTSDGGSPRRFGWCDQGDLTDWNFSSVTNQAGFLDVEPGSPIVSAIAGRNGWVLFFTEKKAYVANYLSLPYVYNYVELADDCTPWSPASITTTSSLILWFSQQGMFSFDGTSILPIQCNVRTWVDNNVDQFAVRWQAAAAHIGMVSEFWWFFPADETSTINALAGNGFNSLAVVYNYKEGWWSQCQMPRSAGVTSSYGALPTFADGQQPYQHEIGNIFNDCALPYADTFDLNLNSGGFLTTVKQMIPDIVGDTTGLSYTLFYRNSRSTGAPELETPPIAIRDDGFVDFRTTGRDIRFRFAVAGPEVNDFTLGQHLIDIVQRGDR